MFTAHRIDDMLTALAHADERMQAMRTSDGELRHYHSLHFDEHIANVMQDAGQLKDNMLEHYPAEAAEWRALVQVMDLVSGYSLNPRSGMISLDLPPGALAPVSGGVDDHHITVVYLGPDVDDEAFAEACRRAQEAASAMPGPLTGTVGGIGSFKPSDGSDGKTPAWAGVVLPGADRIQDALKDLSASQHKDWKPHVTVAYVGPGESLPDPVPQTPVTFTHLSVHRGRDEVVRYPLGGGPVDMAKSVSSTAKAASFAHLLQSIAYDASHTQRHSKAMLADTDETCWQFDADHAEKHMHGTAGHVHKLAELIHDNYPAEEKWLGKLTAKEDLSTVSDGALELGIAGQLGHAGTSIGGQVLLAGWEQQTRDAQGRWVKGLRFSVKPYGVVEDRFAGGNEKGEIWNKVPTAHRITAHHGKTEVGHLDWNVHHGGVDMVHTEEKFRGRGVAMNLFDRAREYAAENGLILPNTEHAIPISPSGLGFHEALSQRNRPGSEVTGQVPLIPRKGANRTTALSLELGSWHDAWVHEMRGAHGEWIRGAEGQGPAPSDRTPYRVPPHSRLVNLRSPYPDPADHPFFKAHPMSSANIVHAYSVATEQQKAQGMRWYADAGLLGAAIAHGDHHLGAGLLSAYSPQTSWPINMFNAARSVEMGRPIGPHEGTTVMTSHANAARKIMDGASFDEALPGPKTNAFARLIETEGKDKPDDPFGEVVVDRHAVSVAAGERLSDKEPVPIGDDRYYQVVADEYRKAAIDASRREGYTISPSQMQAITWLVQQSANEAQDAHTPSKGSAASMAKGRVTRTANAWKNWLAYARLQNVATASGTTALATELELHNAWMTELRDERGRFATSGGVMSEHVNPEGFSLHQRTGQPPRGGFMVSLPGHTHQYPDSIMKDKHKLAEALDKMLMDERETFSKPDVYLGGWVSDGMLWLDPSENVADRDEAVKTGQSRDQVAIWDVVGGREIDTGGTGGATTEHATPGISGSPPGLRGLTRSRAQGRSPEAGAGIAGQAIRVDLGR
jgi:GNAT superfamily N-acetyltransferase